ncbi:RNA polymerase subunit RPO18, partial [Monkeypox virus]
FVFLANIVDS